MLSSIKTKQPRLSYHVSITKTSPPVFMNGHRLDISAFFTQLSLSNSSTLTWKPHIHSIARRAPQKFHFLPVARGFLTFSASNYMQSQIHPSLEYCSHVWDGTPKSSLHLLGKVYAKTIGLINNPHLTNSLQSLSHLRLLQIFSFSTAIFTNLALWKLGILFLIK